jgi:hypothetical protein
MDESRGTSEKEHKKLEFFFGQTLPFDIPLPKVEALGLKGILTSNVPLCYFLYLMLEELCAENLVSMTVYYICEQGLSQSNYLSII